jgi:hypothetical protein
MSSLYASSNNQGEASIVSFQSASGQLLAFLQSLYTKAEEDDEFAAEVLERLYRIPIDEMTRSDITIEDIDCKEFRINDLDMFANYLATEAKQRRKGSEHKDLKMLASDRYRSAVQEWVMNECYNVGHANTSMSDLRQQKRVRNGMIKIYNERSKVEGEILDEIGMTMISCF